MKQIGSKSSCRNIYQRRTFFNKSETSSTYFNSPGQVTVEMILLIAVLVVISQAFMNIIKSRGYLDDFSQTPNKLMSNMIANGNWLKDPEDSKEGHPNRYGRRWSWDPD